MNGLRDLHHEKNKHHTITVPVNIFDTSHDIIGWASLSEKDDTSETHGADTNIKHTKNSGGFLRGFISTVRFTLVTGLLFVLLLGISNWSAYYAFARAIIDPTILDAKQSQIETSLVSSAVQVDTTKSEKKRAIVQKIMKKKFESNEITATNLGAPYFDQDINQITLTTTITPYADTIVIPKIGKNIPLVNVETHDADTSSEWQKIFMKELEKGVVKYPGSADPGTSGNSFIFGHSSNYPWAKGDYNDVFALLNELVAGDEIIVYFKQKKYVYTVREKAIVKPGDVSALGGPTEKKQLTLMTCWPLGTTLNRLLIITEIKEIKETL